MSDQDFYEKIRCDFPALARQKNGKPPIYFDSACTALVPRQVISSLDQYYEEYPACGGRRNNHWFANEAIRQLEGSPSAGITGARRDIADLIHADSEEEIIFTLNTTYAINMVALGFNFHPGDVVLLSGREHNSNLLPWLRLQQAGLVEVAHTAADFSDAFDLDAYENIFKNNRVRLVSMGYTSNITGVTLPAKEIITIAHRYGARVLLDGAQTVPHQTVDVRDLDVDFLAFSVHKMCGPRGVGILYAKSELIGKDGVQWTPGDDFVKPVILGGGTVKDAFYGDYQVKRGPEAFEAGIQDYAGIIASGAAARYLRRIGLARIAAHETELNRYLSSQLLYRYGDMRWFAVLGSEVRDRQGGIVSIVIQRPNAIGMAKELSARNNIMIRDGVSCVHAYFNDQFGANWMHPKSHWDHRMICRASFYLYNTLWECDVFLDTLDEIFRDRCYL